MALTRLSDAIVPEMFFNYMVQDTTERTDIFRSGIIRNDAEIAAKLAGGGSTFNNPFWNDLGSTEADVASDDPAVLGTPSKITAGKDIVVRQVRAHGFSTADLSGVLAGSDPMMRIRSKVNDYWDRQFQASLVATSYGVYLSNVANNSSDMIYSVATDSASAVTSAELIDAEKIIDACYTLGDASEDLKVLAMHSTVVKRLVKLDLIDYVKDSTGNTRIPYYLGKRVIVDDGCKTVTGTNRVTYITMLFGEGAMSWGEAPTPTPVAVKRDEDGGAGMGIETLWTRRQYAMHPNGIKWTSSSMSGEFPTNAELATAANWLRVYPERKQVKIAFLATNG